MIWLHVSELSIDRLLAGELPADDAASMRAHASSCPRCNALFDDALAAQRAFSCEARPAIEIPLPFRERAASRRRFAPWIAASSALAAGFALALVWPRTSSAPSEAVDQVRTKGASIVGFYVAHGNSVRRGAIREQVMPHDRIQLFTTTSARSWVAVVGDDATGMRSVYVAPRPLDAGREQLLPLSIELDATPGDETVTAIFCTEPFDVTSPPASCTEDHFTLAKSTK